MQKAIEEGVMQRNCVINLGQREANVEAVGGKIRLTQSHGDPRRANAVGYGR